LPVGDIGKCLGYWWKGDPVATHVVEENIKKAQRAFIMAALVFFMGPQPYVFLFSARDV